MVARRYVSVASRFGDLGYDVVGTVPAGRHSWGRYQAARHSRPDPAHVPRVVQRVAGTSARRSARATRVPYRVIETTPRTASRPRATVAVQPPAWKATAPSVPPALEPR